MPGLIRAGARALALLSFLTFTLACWAGDSQVRPDCIAFSLSAISASGNDSTAAYVQLGQAKDVSLQFRGVGTLPNFKVEVLCTLDETNYTKPETGGDLGTFTDQNYHVVAISVPFCKGLKLKFTELGGANTITPDGTLCSQ